MLGPHAEKSPLSDAPIFRSQLRFLKAENRFSCFYYLKPGSYFSTDLVKFEIFEPELLILETFFKF